MDKMVKKKPKLFKSIPMKQLNNENINKSMNINQNMILKKNNQNEDERIFFEI